jgi:hypothetical protein
VVVGCGGGGLGVVWTVGGVGSSLALEHSKVCTQCDFGHLQFLFLKNELKNEFKKIFKKNIKKYFF